MNDSRPPVHAVLNTTPATKDTSNSPPVLDNHFGYLAQAHGPSGTSSIGKTGRTDARYDSEVHQHLNVKTAPWLKLRHKYLDTQIHTNPPNPFTLFTSTGSTSRKAGMGTNQLDDSLGDV
jgi:hypothetical protein